MERFGTHRSIEPTGALPQQARRLDATSPLIADELAIDVDYLNIDSASWAQIRAECGDDAERMTEHIVDLVHHAGKMHNPVTGPAGCSSVPWPSSARTAANRPSARA